MSLRHPPRFPLHHPLTTTTGPFLFETTHAPPLCRLKRDVRGLDAEHRGRSAPYLRPADRSIDQGLYSPGITQPQGDLGPCELGLDLCPEESK